MKPPIFLLSILVAGLTLMACQPAGGDPAPDAEPQETAGAATSGSEPTQPARPGQPRGLASPQPTAATQQETGSSIGVNATTYGYTHQMSDGNRLISGRGAMPEAMVIDIPLTGRPVWLVAAPVPTTANLEAAGHGPVSAWAVILEDGRVQAFLVAGKEVSEATIVPAISPIVPPLLKVSEDGLALVLPPGSVYGAAPPAVLDDQGRQAVVSPAGVLTVLDANGSAIATAASPPLPDGRLLSDEKGRLLFLSQPTSRYDHGIAGDAIEAAAVTLFDPQVDGGTEMIVSIPPPTVVEGVMPLWADLNGDGQREVIVTQSNVNEGAQIVVYDEAGHQVAAGPAIGQGYRWRHQLAVAPFGPQGEIELVDVLTPHIGGVVEFFQLNGGRLQIMATVPGYTSHVIGSRNLDMALAGDLDGDGQIELLLPNQARDRLGAIRRTAGGAEVAWSVPLEGSISSNLAGVQLPDDSLLVGAGQDNGSLRLWLPE